MSACVHSVTGGSPLCTAEEREGWVAGDVLPVKLKTEIWTTYAHDFERVEQLRPLSAKASSKKEKKQKKQVRKKVGLQDWHMGDAVTSEVVKLKSRPSLSLSQASQMQHLAKQARQAADEQLQKSLADGLPPGQAQEEAR